LNKPIFGSSRKLGSGDRSMVGFRA
jgi:hypothetical protein